MKKNPDILKCKRFDAKTLPDSVREKCFEEFPMRNFTNEFIAYYEEDDNVEVLGYFLIREQKVTHSKYYDAFKFDNQNYWNHNIDEFVEKKAYQIIEWCMKEELKDKQLLYKVFWEITLAIGELNNTVILWREGNNKLEFHRISNDEHRFYSPSASLYFAERFLQ